MKMVTYLLLSVEVSALDIVRGSSFVEIIVTDYLLDLIQNLLSQRRLPYLA